MEQQNNFPQPPIPPQMPYMGYAPAAPKLELKHHLLKSHDAAAAWLSILMGFLFVRYVVCYADGIITTVFFLLLFAGFSLYLKKSGCKTTLPQKILGAVLCIFPLVFTLTASPLLHGLCALFLLAGNAWRVQAVYAGIPFVSRYFLHDLMQTLSGNPLRHFDSAPQAISESVKKSKSATAVKTVLVALLVTVPLTAIVASLLASADSGMEVLLHKLVQMPPDSIVRLLVQLAVGIPVGWWMFSMAFGKLNIQDDARAEQLSHARVIPNLGLYAGVTPICLLYLIYVCSQLSYFISAFAGKLPADMIYSEYARRGFFELCAIAVINLLVILVLVFCAKQCGETRPKALTFYACVLCGFTLFIIATAIAKMCLYIDAYGLTPLRLYTAWFMVLLAVVFLVVLLRLFIQKIKTAAVLTTAFLAMFALLCFSRPDALIAEYNLTRYERGTLSEVDVSMLLTLSEDAYVIMAKHSETLSRIGAQEQFRHYALNKRDSYSVHPDRSWNLSAWLLSGLTIETE